jgi:DNA-binding NarL/FixJ family response regulator
MLPGTPPDRVGKLGPRVPELVIMVVQGRTNAEIAGQPHISVRTVRHRLVRIRNKAGCPRRAELIWLSLQTGLV